MKAQNHLLPLSLTAIDQLQADTLVIGVHQDVRPLKGAAGFVDWRLCGEISNLVRNQSFNAEAGEILLISGRGRLSAIRIFLMGWGETKTSGQYLQQRCEHIVRMVEQAGCKKVAIALPEPCESLLAPAQKILQSKLGEKLEGVFSAEGPI